MLKSPVNRRILFVFVATFSNGAKHITMPSSIHVCYASFSLFFSSCPQLTLINLPPSSQLKIFLLNFFFFSCLIFGNWFLVEAWDEAQCSVTIIVTVSTFCKQSGEGILKQFNSLLDIFLSIFQCWIFLVIILIFSLRTHLTASFFHQADGPYTLMNAWITFLSLFHAGSELFSIFFVNLLRLYS